MKKEVDILGAEFVLDEFHIRKYIRKMARLGDRVTEEGKEKTAKKLLEWIEKENRKKLEDRVVRRGGELMKKEEKNLVESWEYLKKNWKGVRSRVKKEEGVIGSSTESHISHVLLTRRSLRLMGWSREGADKVSQVRIYWKNGKNMQKLVKLQKEEEKEASHEEENYLSASEILTWERKSSKANRKYIEALRGHKEKSVYNIP